MKIPERGIVGQKVVAGCLVEVQTFQKKDRSPG